jgi:hypothetical protein
MKKLISILVLGVMFTSCNLANRRVKESTIVTKVEEFTKGRYEVSTENYYFCTDSLYRVGDTLKIGKNSKNYEQQTITIRHNISI